MKTRRHQTIADNGQLVEARQVGRATFVEVTEQKVDQSGPGGNGRFVYVDISSIDNRVKRITEPKTLEVAAAPSRAKQKLKAGDVLVSMTRPNLNAVAMVPPELDGAVGSTGFHVLRANEGTEPRWLYYAVQTNHFISSMSELVQGALYPAVRPKDIRAFEIPHPTFDQQKLIVAEIEKQFSRLDEAVANLKRVKANIKRYKAAVLKAAVEGRLVETEAEIARREGRGYETGEQLLQRVLETRRREWKGKGKYKEPTAPDTTDLPELPEGWVWATVEALSMKVSDGVHKKPNYVVDGVPFVTVKNLTAGDGISFEELNYITKEDHKEFCKRTHPERGDILITKDGTLGVVRLIDTDAVFSIFVSVALVKPVSRELSRYLVLALESPPVQRQMVPKGSGLQHIHLEDLRADCIPLPPMAEQQRILTEVDRRFSLTLGVEAQVGANQKRAKRFRQALLASAFAGRFQ